MRHEGDLTMGTNETQALACTLEFSEMGPRLERIRRLAATSLRSHQVDGDGLRLAYRAEAVAEVNVVAALERECCRLLEFEVNEDRKGLALTITAPTGVGEAAQWHFAQFLPASSGEAPARPCCASCA